MGENWGDGMKKIYLTGMSIWTSISSGSIRRDVSGARKARDTPSKKIVQDLLQISRGETKKRVWEEWGKGTSRNSNFCPGPRMKERGIRGGILCREYRKMPVGEKGTDTTTSKFRGKEGDASGVRLPFGNLVSQCVRKPVTV